MFPLKWNLLLVIVICDPQIYGIVKLRIPRQIVDITCSACDRRLAAEPPQVCCRCIDQSATCNNDIATQAGPGKELPTGIACKSSIECESSGDCDPSKEFCKVHDLNSFMSLRFAEGEKVFSRLILNTFQSRICLLSLQRDRSKGAEYTGIMQLSCLDMDRNRCCS